MMLLLCCSFSYKNHLNYQKKQAIQSRKNIEIHKTNTFILTNCFIFWFYYKYILFLKLIIFYYVHSEFPEMCWATNFVSWCWLVRGWRRSLRPELRLTTELESEGNIISFAVRWSEGNWNNESGRSSVRSFIKQSTASPLTTRCYQVLSLWMLEVDSTQSCVETPQFT